MQEDLEHKKFELEKQKISNEHQARLEELRIRESELKRQTLRPSWFQILSGIVIALLTVLGTAFTAYYKGQSTVNVERLRFESDLIMKAIETGNDENSAKNLLFFVKAGFLTDENGKIKELNEEPEKSPVLPTDNSVRPSKIDAAALSSLNLGYYYALLAKSAYGGSSEELFNFLGLTLVKSIDENPFHALLLSTQSGQGILVIALKIEFDEYVSSDQDLVKVSSITVHRGLWNALDKVWPKILAAVQKHHRSRPIAVVGHGLGGGLSILAAWRLHSSDHTVSAVVTFGQPRVGGRKFARIYNAELATRTIRFALSWDRLTNLPLRAMGYRHVGKPVVITSEGILPDLFAWNLFLDRMSKKVGETSNLSENSTIEAYLTNLISASHNALEFTVKRSDPEE